VVKMQNLNYKNHAVDIDSEKSHNDR